MGKSCQTFSVYYFCAKNEVESLPRACLAEMGGLWRMCGAQIQIILIMRYSGVPPKKIIK